jgi:hypothetical protein
MCESQVVNRSFEAAGVVEGGASPLSGQGRPQTQTLTKVYSVSKVAQVRQENQVREASSQRMEPARSPTQLQRLQMEHEGDVLQASHAEPLWHQAQPSSPSTQPREGRYAKEVKGKNPPNKPTALFESLFEGL